MRSIPDVYGHPLQQKQFLFHIDVNGQIYVTILTEELEHTISKKLTIFRFGDTRFLIIVIIEEYIVDCFEIGSH